MPCKMTAEVAKKAVDLGLLEEDDEFEEFPNKERDIKDISDVNVWEDNWDDDAVEDDFSVQLHTYSRKRPHSHSPPLRSPEPLAKKVCSRPTPPASPVTTSRASRRAMNGVSNGHTNGNSAPAAAAPQEVEMEEPAAERTSGRRSGSRRGGSSSRDTSESRTPPTRSSARLRSSRK